MCFTSAVFDQFGPYIPQPTPQPAPVPGQWQWPAVTINPPTIPAPVWPNPEELRQLLDAFHKAVEAAKAFDDLTGQPDCEDPEKAKLLARVAELERRLDAMESA